MSETTTNTTNTATTPAEPISIPAGVLSSAGVKPKSNYVKETNGYKAAMELEAKLRSQMKEQAVEDLNSMPTEIQEVEAETTEEQVVEAQAEQDEVDQQVEEIESKEKPTEQERAQLKLLKRKQAKIEQKLQLLTQKEAEVAKREAEIAAKEAKFARFHKEPLKVLKEQFNIEDPLQYVLELDLLDGKVSPEREKKEQDELLRKEIEDLKKAREEDKKAAIQEQNRQRAIQISKEIDSLIAGDPEIKLLKKENRAQAIDFAFAFCQQHYQMTLQKTGRGEELPLKTAVAYAEEALREQLKTYQDEDETTAPATKTSVTPTKPKTLTNKTASSVGSNRVSNFKKGSNDKLAKAMELEEQLKRTGVIKYK